MQEKYFSFFINVIWRLNVLTRQTKAFEMHFEHGMTYIIKKKKICVKSSFDESTAYSVYILNYYRRVNNNLFHNDYAIFRFFDTFCSFKCRIDTFVIASHDFVKQHCIKVDTSHKVDRVVRETTAIILLMDEDMIFSVVAVAVG